MTSSQGPTPDVDEPPQHDDKDIDIADGDMLHPLSNPPANNEVENDQMRFMEVFEGCVVAFPGGKTFLSNFHDDQYALQ